MRTGLLSALPLLALAQTAVAAEPQAASDAPPGVATPTLGDDIIVTAPRIEGDVITTAPPILELNEQAIESYGAASITELLAALSPQTGSGRGRGGGQPVVLLNGLRISGFAELRDLPPEAIKRVQVLPEEVALQYGFSADQRVVNFILKDDFKAITIDLEGGAATAGKFLQSEQQATLVRIGKSGRINLSGQRTSTSSVLESDRDITQRSGLPANAGDFRTLRPSAVTTVFNGTINRKLSDAINATINASYQVDTANSLLGLPNPLPNPLQGLARKAQTDALATGLTVNGAFAPFNWTLTGNYARTINNTATQRSLVTTDTARSVTDTSSGIYTISGPVLEAPAGAIRTTARLGFATSRLNGSATRNGITAPTDLARDEGNGRLTVEIPIASRARGVLGFLGKLSVNANVSYRKLSDFGGLTSYGYGLNWQPLDGLTFLASAIDTRVEPGIADLGAPLIVTPGVPTYDFVRGQAVLVTQTSGGNGALIVETQRDAKFSINYQPKWLAGMNFNVDYFRNRSNNPVQGFPLLTPDIEAAFPGRVTRDASGALIAIDTRSVNFARTESDVVRVGFTFQKQFDQPAGGGGMGGFGRGGGGGGGGMGRPGGGGGGGGGGFGGPGAQGGRWTVGIYDSIRFRDQILIRSGVPLLNLLGGDATGSNGGSPRHSVDLDAGWFHNGLGFRLTGNYSSGSVVDGTASGSTLRFGDLATLTLNAFYNFDGNKKLVERVPFLKGSRLRLQVANITNAIREVRDGAGLVPLNYQAGYLDPRGRYLEIDFRKRF